MLLASTIGKIVQPLFKAFAWAIAGFYSLVPNYAIAIALLTVAVMIVVFPITRRGTRSMMKMQILAPELKKLQAKFKVPPGATVAERQEIRQRQNEEMMALYKENGVSPTGGCLPMFLQFPIFIILYDTIKALTHTVKVHGKTVLDPLYISHSTRLYHAIESSGGDLRSFGINLADSVRTTGLSWSAKIPYIVMILVAIALQYIQMKQLSGRNPAAAAANPQMQQMQKIFPIIFAVIYIAIPAGVNVYFIVSSLFRISQQEFMYRRDPQIVASMEKIRSRTKADPKVVEAKLAIERATEGGRPRGLLGKLLPTANLQPEPTGMNGASASVPGNSSSNGRNPRRRSNGRSSKGSAAAKPPASRRSQSRAQNKRPRRPR